MYILIVILFFSNSLLFANTTVNFKAGSENRINYIDIYEQPFFPKSDLTYSGFLYGGLTLNSYVGFNQIIFTATPGVLLYNELDNNTLIYKPSFFFRDIFIRWDGIVSLIIGKRPLGWGIGYLRQFSFFVNTEFAEETQHYYNAELQGRIGAVLLSTGVAADTTSIDKLEKPTWYAPWFYIKIDNSKYTVQTSFSGFWEENQNWDLKGSIEFQYFLPKGWEIYSTFTHNFISQNQLGDIDQIQFLAGLSYEYFYSSDLLMRIIFEYIREEKTNIISTGLLFSLYKQATLLTFFNIEHLENKKEFIPELFLRIQWEPIQYFNLQLTYSHVFQEIEPIFERNRFDIRILWEL